MIEQLRKLQVSHQEESKVWGFLQNYFFQNKARAEQVHKKGLFFPSKHIFTNNTSTTKKKKKSEWHRAALFASHHGYACTRGVMNGEGGKRGDGTEWEWMPESEIA